MAGEPGIGKTRLLDELRALAHRRGHLVLSGRAAKSWNLLPPGEPVRAGVVAYCAGVEHLLGGLSQARARLREAYHGLVEPDAVRVGGRR